MKIKKTKNAVSFLIAIVFGFSLISSVSASEARMPFVKCPSCGGMAFETRTRTYAHDETFPCKHGKSGVDYYHAIRSTAS